MSPSHTFPCFRRQIVHSASAATDILPFPKRRPGKGRGRDDLIILSTNPDSNICDIVLHHHSPDYKPLPEPSLPVWERLKIHSLRNVVCCTTANISESGLTDVLIAQADVLDDQSGSPLPSSTRISWIENVETDESDWPIHHLGEYPGINLLRTGHFTTTYSIQVLATVSSHVASTSSVVILTRPTDVYNRRPWFATLALEGQIAAIRDCVVVNTNDGSLDRLIISCAGGLAVAWYHDKHWNLQYIITEFLPTELSTPNVVATGRLKNVSLPFIATVDDHHVLSVYITPSLDRFEMRTEKVTWKRYVIEDFRTIAIEDFRVHDIACADVDGDGSEELLVSVSSSAGRGCVFYYNLEEKPPRRYRVDRQAVRRIVCGRFVTANEMAVATIYTDSAHSATIHTNGFMKSEVVPTLENSELILRMPCVPSMIHELDLIDVAGISHSLVLVPPDACFHFPTDGSNAIKVLRGCVGWIDHQSEVIERTRVLSGCVTSMLVDSPEGYIRSGNDGAVFIRMRPSSRSTEMDLCAYNTLPDYFPSDVIDTNYHWHVAHPVGHHVTNESDVGLDVYRLPVCQLLFAETSDHASPTGHRVTVDFWASPPSTTLTQGRQSHARAVARQSARMHDNDAILSVQACLSNPSGLSGLRTVHRQALSSDCNWARRVILPRLHEYGSFVPVTNHLELAHPQEEPTGHQPIANPKERHISSLKWDVWASYDFDS